CRSAIEIWAAVRFTAIGLDEVYAHCLSRACALKLMRPCDSGVPRACRFCAFWGGGAASRSPLLNVTCEGFAVKPVRSTFHELPFTRRLRASICPLICGALSEPLTVAFMLAVP